MNRLEMLALERWLEKRVEDASTLDLEGLVDPRLSYWENKRIVMERLGIRDVEGEALSLLEMAAEYGDEEARRLLEELRPRRRRARRKRHVPSAEQRAPDPLREVERILGRRYVKRIVEILSP